ncbi:MAG: hypothetical protein K9J06_01235 [Flavobacteriales bacterium]|nr:hypothetical protein [Flavobacteriales bacterium]
MKAPDDLFDLVKALSPAEKRYFKVISAKVNGKEGNFMQLFDALDSLEEHDDEKLKKKLKGATFLRYISAEKGNLYAAIMRAMRNFYSEKSVDTRIFELMQEEVFLRGKGLNELRELTLAKAEALARKYEKYTYLLEILLAQKDLITEFEEKRLTERVREKLEEIEDVVALQQTFAKLTLASDEIFIFARSGTDLKNESNRQHLETLADDIRILANRLRGSFRLTLKYHAALSHYYGSMGDREQCYYESAKALEVCESSPDMIKEDGQKYKVALANYLTRAHARQDYSRFEEKLAILKALPADDFYAEGEVFQNVYFVEHLYYINAGRFEEAEALVSIIEEGLVTYARKINRSRVLSFTYNIMVMYFLMHKFKEARIWSERILDEKSDIRQDMQTANRILYPIICYELGKFDILDNITRAAYRYLLAQQRLHEFERLVIRYLQTMPFTANEKEFEEKLEAFATEMEGFKKSENFKRSGGMEEVELWINSKRGGRPMRELL